MPDIVPAAAITAAHDAVRTPPASTSPRNHQPRKLLTGTPGRERRDGATVDLAAYEDDPEYRARIDARIAGERTARNFVVDQET